MYTSIEHCFGCNIVHNLNSQQCKREYNTMQLAIYYKPAFSSQFYFHNNHIHGIPLSYKTETYHLVAVHDVQHITRLKWFKQTTVMMHAKHCIIRNAHSYSVCNTLWCLFVLIIVYVLFSCSMNFVNKQKTETTLTCSLCYVCK